MKTILRISVVIFLLTGCCAAYAKHPITYEDLAKVRRVSEPQLSPDGKWIAYVVGVVDLAANRINRHIWLIPVEGGAPQQLTQGEGSDARPRWSPDGNSLAFISTRGSSSQVWIVPVHGGEARPLTSLATEADGVSWAAHGNQLIVTSQVYPECADEACNARRLKEASDSKVKARVIDELLYRHWDTWRDGKYAHLFSVSAADGTSRDLTPGAYDSPTWFLGAPDGYAISPDGTEVCYTSNHSQGSAGQSAAAWTTNDDLYLVSTRAAKRGTLPATIQALTLRRSTLPTDATLPSPPRLAMAMNPIFSGCGCTTAKPRRHSTSRRASTSGWRVSHGRPTTTRFISPRRTTLASLFSKLPSALPRQKRCWKAPMMKLPSAPMARG